jgi:hypothetical protein
VNAQTLEKISKHIYTNKIFTQMIAAAAAATEEGEKEFSSRARRGFEN